eukprot:TRINITY_DN6112_c0_g1_i2.p1 TRINITY_DN6112_c0_g1~~TRINITY_DN6112_c0_g1_i2.p1  ORF type:complete len:125 (-),score=3.10 TRINITY_DN6112_c0_g1_i2:151-525(-)
MCRRQFCVLKKKRREVRKGLQFTFFRPATPSKALTDCCVIGSNTTVQTGHGVGLSRHRLPGCLLFGENVRTRDVAGLTSRKWGGVNVATDQCSVTVGVRTHVGWVFFAAERYNTPPSFPWVDRR